jgi:hypothetical protein
MSRVGQFLGKLFAGNSGKNETVLRAYGKLPFYAEYRRLEVAPGTPTVFSQWLDEGRLAWVQSTPESARGTTRTSRVVLRWPDSRDLVVATIWDSRDSLGRIFPFAFFVACPPEALGEDRAQRCTSCLALHEHFDRLHTRLCTMAAGGDFYRLYRGYTVPLRPENLATRTEELRQRARTVTLEEWFAAASLGSLKAGDWFASMRQRAQRWSSQPGGLSESALGFPLARGLPCAVQAILWLEWLAALFPTLDREPAMVVPTEDAPGVPRMQVVFRNLMPHDFQLLTSDAGTYGYVEDLGQLPAGAANGNPGVELAAPTGPLLEALLRPMGH